MSESTHDVLERIQSRCVKDLRGCLIWQGTINSKGYGIVSVYGQNQFVHRLVFEFLRDRSIPFHSGIVVNHKPTCSSKACCEFYHLSGMTKEEHDALPEEGSRTPRHVVRGGTCRNGHLVTEANTIIRRGSFECRDCKNVSNNKSHHKIRWGVGA